MNSYTTKTREFGEVTFYAPAATDTDDAYIWIDTGDGKRRQICEGGVGLGVTVTSTAPNLKATAQRWMRQRRAWMRKEGLT
jgi:hypothetical protein